jgi:hypothetical protein
MILPTYKKPNEPKIGWDSLFYLMIYQDISIFSMQNNVQASLNVFKRSQTWWRWIASVRKG